MATHIAVSFEGEFIKVVYASSVRENITIRKTLTLRDEEFDSFLENERARRFTVVSDFKSPYHDILFLPPAREKYLKKLVESEIRRRAPELQDFSFFYLVLGEATREGKRGKDVFAFAVSNADLFRIIDRFSRHNKTVRHIYPGVFTLSRLVSASVGSTDEPLLCMMESGLSKTLFLVKGGKLYFVRTAQSLESGFHDLDAHDVNMTVNYCRQTLKFMPSQIVLLGNVCRKYETSADFTIPVICMDVPRTIRMPAEEDGMDFIVPLSSLVPDKGFRPADVLPQSYRSFILQKSILACLTIAFLALSCLGGVYIKGKMSDIAKTRSDIGLLRDEIRRMEQNRLSYEAGSREIRKLMPLVNFINRANASPDFQKALVALSSLGVSRMSNIHIRSIDINAGSEALALRVKGDIAAERFADMQKAYRNLIDEIKKTRGMEAVSGTMDLNGKSFQVEAKYRSR